MIEHIEKVLTDFEVRENVPAGRYVPGRGIVPWDCPVCEDARIVRVQKDGRFVAQVCECAYEKDRQADLEKLRSHLDKDIADNLDNPKKRDWQAKAYEAFRSGRGVWMHGPSGGGKTFLSAFAVKKHIEATKAGGGWEWITARVLMNLWLDQYGDGREKSKAKLAEILRSRLIILNDIDKIGNITQAKEDEIFEMLETFKKLNTRLIISSQYSVEAFFDRFSQEKEMKMRGDSIGPRARRVLDLCEEVYVGNPVQQTLKGMK